MKAISGILVTRVPDGEDTVKILNNNSFADNKFDPSYEVLENKDIKEVEKYLLKKGDVAIMSIEPFYVVYITEDNVLATSVLYKVIDNVLSNVEIYKLLNTKKFRAHIEQNIEGTSLKRLSSKNVSDFKYDKSDYEDAEFYFSTIQLLKNNRQKLDTLLEVEKKLCE